MKPPFCALAVAVAACLSLPAPLALAAPITLFVDASDSPRKILHVRETIPCEPGSFAITYPRWIPGEHGPTGPLTDVAALRINAGGKPLAWRRDDVDMYTVWFTVPAGAKSVEVSFDFLAVAAAEGFTSAASFTDHVAILNWNQVLVYPAGAKSDDLTYAASLQLPAGWAFGTPLPIERRSGSLLTFRPSSLTTLVDSPVLAGDHFRTIDLTPGETPPMVLDLACDGEAGLAMDERQVAAYRKLAREAKALFGATHFRSYHFLVSASDHIAHFGLEHHESSDDRVHERTFVDADLEADHSNLLSHELVHSWNGKFRRPAGLATGNYHDPMKGEMLWVYEGLTQYLGFVLAARSGVRTPRQTEDNLALQAAYLDARPGRTWRPLIDTAIEAQRLYEASARGEAARRGTDFYNEGLLTWLEADVTIRRLTHGEKSLDDFCRLFHGGESDPPRVVTYGLGDLVAALDAVAPYDWRAFWNQRLTSLSPRAPMGGIEGGGWNVAYADSEQAFLASLERADKGYVEEWFSIGITVDQEKSEIADVLPGSPAARAGVVPGETLIAVNGRKWTKDVLRDAIRATRSGVPLELLTLSGEFYRAHRLEWRGGVRYPRLERRAGTPDVLGAILRPRTP